MTVDLRPADFASFFQAIHGCEPFPWQQSLVNRLAASDEWPDVLELPTGSGKTAALDVGVFHLALCAHAPGKAALRIAFVVDRRLVVDDAHSRAEKITKALCHALDGDVGGCAAVEEVARRLRRLAGYGGPPLVAKRLRGGVPLENDWARTPSQPTILCSTVDQVGSRLLFRGYGVSDRMKPVHAGLLGTNSLILLDEAHLAAPFLQTLDALRKVGHVGIKVALLSATPGKKVKHRFMLSHEDRANSTLRKRLEARKPATLKPPVRGGLQVTAEAFAVEARAMATRLQLHGVSPYVVGVVVNRIALARNIFSELDRDDGADAVLMIGRSRGVDRNVIAAALAPFRTDAENRGQAKPLFVVATQCLEVGVDLDLDGLVTQAASLDALHQRFGRLNRAGRRIQAEGAIFALAEDISKKANDPVYGDRIRLTWDALKAIAEGDSVDFGVETLPKLLKDADIDLYTLASEKPNAPVLMPAYLDLWSQTLPRPTADPEVALFLHGAERSAAGVSIVWRSDISEADLAGLTSANLKEVIRLVPPRAAESIDLPIWVARAWLRQSGGTRVDISDIPEREADTEDALQRRNTGRRAFRWAGLDDPNTGVIHAHKLQIGDLLVVPAEYGGCDGFGWAPDFNSSVVDVADEAAKPYWGRRCAVRIARDIVSTADQWKRISEVLVSENISTSDLLDRLLSAVPPKLAEGNENGDSTPRDVRVLLEVLQRSKGRIDLHFPYTGTSAEGAILVAERGIDEVIKQYEYATMPTTEGEIAFQTFGGPVRLDCHGSRVAYFAKNFARILGFEDVAGDLGLAAYLHDAGKADPRFQTFLAGGDPWNRPDGPPLAKSGRSLSPQAWERAKLPKGWRHEALSVRMAQAHPGLASARDPDLVLWLIGSHHGFGRPFFHFLDPSPERPLPCLDVTEWRLSPEMLGADSMAFNFAGFDWPSLFEVLKQRYGIWGLAHLEAILRLADHRASEEERIS